MIVKAESNHLKDITAIENQSFDKPWSLQSFLSEFSNKASSNWVYIKNNRVIGYLFGWKIDYDYHINNIAVDLLERRKGIAEKMIDNIIFNLNVKNIFLEVSDFNKGAISLYRKLDFKESGSRTKYYHDGSDAILYKLEVK
tara:strand:+ start:200 stop:622 length:423 start_codon:yes stop_codon:yes gene_type:complete